MIETRQRIGAGTLIMIVGPSGGGKDTLIAGARVLVPQDSPVYFPRRLITRVSDRKAEDHDTLSNQEFAERQGSGKFALHWKAHGLCYGIPSEIDKKLRNGNCVVFNGSRSVIVDAMAKYRSVVVVEVTAPAEILASRLAARGRETSDDIRQRLERANWRVPSGVRCITITNTETPQIGAKRLVDAIFEASKPAG